MKEPKRLSRAFRRTPQAAAHSEEQAERWVAKGLKAADLVAKDLAGLKGSDLRRLAMAELLRKKTTVSLEWIVNELSMRSAANVIQQLRRFQGESECKAALRDARGSQAGMERGNLTRILSHSVKICTLTPFPTNNHP